MTKCPSAPSISISRCDSNDRLSESGWTTTGKPRAPTTVSRGSKTPTPPPPRPTPPPPPPPLRRPPPPPPRETTARLRLRKRRLLLLLSWLLPLLLLPLMSSRRGSWRTSIDSTRSSTRSPGAQFNRQRFGLSLSLKNHSSFGSPTLIKSTKSSKMGSLDTSQNQNRNLKPFMYIEDKP